MLWEEYFKLNHRQRRTIPWEKGVQLPESMRMEFVRSLQRFQLGESGDGRCLRRHALTEPPEYRAALEWFIREEQEHARLMGRVLDALKEPKLEWHWTDWGFEKVRRLLGLKMEIMVLLVAEMIAKRYFRALHEGVEDSVVKAIAGQIGHDEEGHLAFQVDFLRQAFAGSSFFRRLLVAGIWRLMFRAACLLVWWDHGRLLRQCGVTAEGFWWDCGLIFDEVSAGVFAGAAQPSLSSRACRSFIGNLNDVRPPIRRGVSGRDQRAPMA